jgi:hypothetical protein
LSQLEVFGLGRLSQQPFQRPHIQAQGPSAETTTFKFETTFPRILDISKSSGMRECAGLNHNIFFTTRIEKQLGSKVQVGQLTTYRQRSFIIPSGIPCSKIWFTSILLLKHIARSPTQSPSQSSSTSPKPLPSSSRQLDQDKYTSSQ